MRQWNLKLLCVLILTSNILMSQSPQRKIAENYLESCWGIIPSEMKIDYGFAKTESLKDMYLDDPFNLYKITLAAIENYKQGDSIGTLLIKTDLWYFPITVNKEIRAFIIVDKVENDFKAVSFGYASLATELNILDQKWPASKGYHLQIAVSFQTNTLLYTIPEIDNHNLTIIKMPNNITSKKSTQILNNKTLGELSSTIEELKKEIQNITK